MGARHALFPRFTGIGRPHHPSSDYWLPVPRRCVIPQERLRYVSVPQRNLIPVLTLVLCWVRLLCPVLRLSADTHSPNTDR